MIEPGGMMVAIIAADPAAQRDGTVGVTALVTETITDDVTFP
jgi:hypothetical protein